MIQTELCGQYGLYRESLVAQGGCRDAVDTVFRDVDPVIRFGKINPLVAVQRIDANGHLGKNCGTEAKEEDRKQSSFHRVKSRRIVD